MTFFEKFLRGEAQRDDIFKYIEDWHKASHNKSVLEYLGVTKEQYHLFLMEPDKVESLRKKNQKHKTVANYGEAIDNHYK